MKTARGARARRALFVSVALLTAASLAIAAPATGAASPAPVDLGTADPFVVLAGTTITDVPNSVIAGNVGLSPDTGAGIGVGCSEVTGTIYSVDAAGPLPCRVTDPGLLTTAKNALTAAYTDVAGRTPVTTVPTELGGTTRTPGVYDSASTTFGITAGAGPLILDAKGDPNGVFIFEMGADGTGLTAGSSSQVQLAGGAQACNVFWRLTSATIDTNAVFKGNVLALMSITVNTGANVEGRLLARNGQVSLDHDTITRSVCATAGTTTTTTTTTTTPLNAPPAQAVPAVPRFTG